MLHILALFLAALSALGAPTPQKSTSLPMRAVKRDGGIQLRLVLVEHDDAEIYFKTPYARGRVREEHGARVFDLAPGEDLTAKPISFTQVTRATQDGGKHKTEHEVSFEMAHLTSSARLSVSRNATTTMNPPRSYGSGSATR